jgi:hypothetical protein
MFALYQRHGLLGVPHSSLHRFSACGVWQNVNGIPRLLQANNLFSLALGY